MTALSLSILWIFHTLLIPVLSPLSIGVTRKVKARLQNRKGASIFQPYRDLWKLFHKDEVVSTDASWIFRWTPILLFAITVVVGASIPLVSYVFSNNLTNDFLLIIYLMALGTFFLALAGMDTGSAFGGFGSSREMMVASLTEGGLVLSLLALAFVAKTTNLFSIASAVSSLSFSHLIPLVLVFLAFSIALLAETCRYPFDNPATHLELTMIHEAMILEYSGRQLGLVEWASANKYLIFIVLGANLFFPWGLVHSLTIVSLVGALGVLVCKIAIFCTVIACLESTTAKLRIFKLPDLLFTSFILSVIAIGLIV